MSYQLTRQALADLDDIAAFLLSEYPAEAPQVEMAFREIFGLVAEFPGIGRPGPIPGTKEMPLRRYPYVVIFYPEATHVTILRVFHTSRDPGTKF